MTFESGQEGPDGRGATGAGSTGSAHRRGARRRGGRRRGSARRNGSVGPAPVDTTPDATSGTPGTASEPPTPINPTSADTTPWEGASPELVAPVTAAAGPGSAEPERGSDPGDASSSSSQSADAPSSGRSGRRPAGRHGGGHGRAGRDLRAATAVGVSLLLLIAASLFFWMPAFVGMVIIAVVLAVTELSQAMNTRGVTVPVVPVLIGAVLMCIGAYVGGVGPLVATFGLTVMAVGVWRLGDPAGGYLRDVSAGIFTTVYVPLLAGFVLLLAASDDGTWAVIALLAVVVASDTGGYAAGVLFGKHLMSPTVSPKKSWEGLVGSLLLGSAVGVGVILLGFDGPWWNGLILGAVGVVSATVGDLGESMLKRDLGIKDMSTLLPGHGGIMDRADSILPSAPMVWLVLTLTVGL